MPRRLVTRRFWVRHRGLIGFLILSAATLIALHVALDASERGQEAHDALCANRVDLQRRIAQNRAYLTMSEAERIRRFGVEFSHVPRATILVQIAAYTRTIHSYDALKC